jgi:hypothetical protein
MGLPGPASEIRAAPGGGRDGPANLERVHSVLCPTAGILPLEQPHNVCGSGGGVYLAQALCPCLLGRSTVVPAGTTFPGGWLVLQDHFFICLFVWGQPAGLVKFTPPSHVPDSLPFWSLPSAQAQGT